MGRQAEPRPARWVVGGAFGSADARWHADPEDDPAEVAAAWLQHRLLRRIAARMGTAEVAPAEVARRIGKPERSTYRAVRGERLVPLDELVAWAAAFGTELFDDFPDSVSDLLPPGVPALAGDGGPGAAQPMRFVRRTALTDVPWAEVTVELATWLDATRACGTTHFLDPRVLLHALVTALFRHGVPPGVAHPGSNLGPHAEAWFDDPHPAVLVVVVDLDDSADREHSVAATRRVVEALFAAAGHDDADTRLVCQVLGRRAKERLDGYVERDGDRLRLPFDRLRVLPGSDERGPANLSGRELTEAEATEAVILVWSVDKPDLV